MPNKSLFVRFLSEYDIILCIVINILPSISAFTIGVPDESLALRAHIVLAFITGGYVLYKFADEVLRDSNRAIIEIRNFVGSNVGLQLPKGAEEAIEYLNKISHKVVRIENTVVVTAKSDDGFWYDADGSLTTRLNLYDTCLIREGLVWHDVVLHDMKLYKRRFRNLEREQIKARMNVYQLQHDIPLVNFLVLQFADGGAEVLFGWGLHGKDPSGKVFLSSNSDLVEYFRRYHRALREAAIKVPLEDIYDQQAQPRKMHWVVRLFRQLVS